MPVYNVHLYREMRLYFPGIEAETPRGAITIADAKQSVHADAIEECDAATISALVDIDGDHDYQHSQMIDLDPAANAHALLSALKDLLAPETPDILHDHACRHCARDYTFEGVPADRLCLSDDCPGFIARAALRKAEPDPSPAATSTALL